MLDRTKVLTTAIALLSTLFVSLPIAQGQANANEKQNTETVNTALVHRKEQAASRNEVRLAFGSPAYNKQYAKSYMKYQYGWSTKQYNCLVTLWDRESGWRADAHNRSGAHGIPQALPGKKMAKFGTDWKTNPQTQIKWGLEYIKKGYSTPCGALGAWNRKGWY